MKRTVIIGKGKTGSEVVARVPVDSLVAVCGRSNPVTPELLEACEQVIIFVPGQAMLDLIPTLIASGKPVVSGSTGLAWPSDLDQQLKERGVAWIVGSNFATGVQLMLQCARLLGVSLPQATGLKLADVTTITDLHHIHKRDAPSGTALSLLRALGDKNVPITSLREADAVGTHTLTFQLGHETLMLEHKSSDRSIFAEGALRAAEQLDHLAPGLYHIEDLFQ
jgi:4-hydroxy-tetrahydrodipicolinate reductase